MTESPKKPIAWQTPEWAAALRFKYAEMLEMRTAHADGTEDAAKVRTRMVALSNQFPGALLEIDRLELNEIRVRLERIERVIDGTGPTEDWMAAVAFFHAALRGALRIKRWLSKREVTHLAPQEDPAEAFRRAFDALPLSEETALWRDDLERIARPPNGRVTELALEKVATVLGRSPDDIRKMRLDSLEPATNAHRPSPRD